MIILCFLILHWYLSLFAQTFFLHRYAAHAMFTMNKFWEKTFFVMTFVFQGSSYLSPFAYGILHRMHHAYADTENDPHSPKYDHNLFSMMWRTKVIYSKLADGNESESVESRFIQGVPRWDSFDQFANGYLPRIGWMVFYTLIYVMFATHWWMFLLLPIHYAMGPIHGAIINWFSHKYGYTNFEVEDTSRNLLPLDFLMMGEAYHNNHHCHSTRPNFGVRWFEIDFTYPVIIIFDKLGIIHLKQTAKIKI